jgi:hypothetical protein
MTEEECPTPSHKYWDRGFVGARPTSFPVHIGVWLATAQPETDGCKYEFLDGKPCLTPTLMTYGGLRLCLAHALIQESLAAGRTDNDLKSFLDKMDAED